MQKYYVFSNNAILALKNSIYDGRSGEISFSSVFSWVSSSVRLFRSLIRLITLSKTAQSTKKATTPMAQITINVSVWLSIFMIL